MEIKLACQQLKDKFHHAVDKVGKRTEVCNH